MPIWLRTFTFRNMNEYYEEEAKAYKKAGGKSTSPSSIPKGPAIRTPNYSTKARQ